ncbi:MAG TPA: pseudouridine synthase, partial [Bacillota bacterium]|nr:pseudouridine synthase [Bacillota bacterium]
CVANEALVGQLVTGVPAEEGTLRARRAEVLRVGTRNSWLAVVLDEGKNRHIRRLLEGLGIEVLRLIRVAIGPLELGDLPKGAFRHLTAAEVRYY